MEIFGVPISPGNDTNQDVSCFGGSEHLIPVMKYRSEFMYTYLIVNVYIYIYIYIYIYMYISEVGGDFHREIVSCRAVPACVHARGLVV